MPIDYTEYPEIHIGFTDPTPLEPLHFKRFNPFGGIPTIDPDQFEVLSLQFLVRLISAPGSDHAGEEILLPVTEMSWTQARGGSPSMAEVSTSIQYFADILKTYGYADVHDWSRKNPRVLVYFLVRIDRSQEWNRLFVGQLDRLRPQFVEDNIVLSVRDIASRLWDSPVVFEIWKNSTADVIVRDIAAITKMLTKVIVDVPEAFQTQAGAASEEPVATVVDFAHPTYPMMGILDAAESGARWLRVNGSRPVDVILNMAAIVDAVFFVMDATIFFLPAEILVPFTGKYILTYGKNLIDFDFDHSAYQSEEATLIVAVHSPDATVLMNKDLIIDGEIVGTEQEVDTESLETLYVVIDSLEAGPRFASKPVDLEPDRRYYHVERFGLNVDEAAYEAVRLFRDVLSKEYTVFCTIAGRPEATILERYIVMGTGTVLDGNEFEAKALSHRVSSGGWTTELVLTLQTWIQGSLNPQNAVPSELEPPFVP